MAANPTVLYPPPGPSDTPATSAKLLTVDSVSLEYCTRERIVRATHEVSFDVYGGDRFVLLGPSGCGKSTLLKAVAGFIEPTAGTIRIDDKPVRGPGTDQIALSCSRNSINCRRGKPCCKTWPFHCASRRS